MRTGNWARGGAAAILILATILFAPAIARAQELLHRAPSVA